MLPSQPNIQIAADIVKSAFPAKGFADLVEVAGFLGIAKKTAQNWVSAGQFPVQTVLINGRRQVPIPAIIHYLASTSGLTLNMPGMRHALSVNCKHMVISTGRWGTCTNIGCNRAKSP
jgi:hypothetical protein